MIRALALVLGLAVAGCSSQAADRAAQRAAPGREALPRVVSINPCVDAVLMQVADPAQIAAISHYSQDERATSIPLEQARRFAATSGTAEEVVALAPDIVIAGSHVAPSTISALHRMNIPLIQIGVPESIDESSAQVRTIAAAIRQPARGEALVARIDDAVRAASASSAAPSGALIWQGGGLVPGDGTLASELLRVTGFRNLSADYGLKQWDVLPLEYMVAKPPQVLLSVGAHDRSDRMLGHPVLAGLKQQIAVRRYPEKLLHCGGPTIIDAVGHLAQIRRTL
ncbi:ABC transporter substrate-binding protein [Blastomonas sp. AAP25]|uniref:ABC transporter substrate-binding protein n=1 Tax=Blastomonas sp. AAP25 TaxID=1523416 RepID=UPI0006B8EE83|nr:ABC transporter substrate-binding protein [Blastomonas sp. AAP25]KPF74151.1 ABC transporter substrate-binding protein [Blastomonas sp. AAP25]